MATQICEKWNPTIEVQDPWFSILHAAYDIEMLKWQSQYDNTLTPFSNVYMGKPLWN